MQRRAQPRAAKRRPPGRRTRGRRWMPRRARSSTPTATPLPRGRAAAPGEAPGRTPRGARRPRRVLVRQASERPRVRRSRRRSWARRRPRSWHRSLRRSLQWVPRRPRATAGRPAPAGARFEGDRGMPVRRPGLRPPASRQPVSPRAAPQEARRTQPTQRRGRGALRRVAARDHRRVGGAVRSAGSAGGRPLVTASARRVR